MVKTPDYIETRLFINNEWVTSTEKIHLVRPFDEEPLASVSAATSAHVDTAVTAALAAFPAWEALGPAGRKPYFAKLARLLRENVDEIAMIEALNLGRGRQITQWEVENAASSFEYYAEAALNIKGESTIYEQGKLCIEVKQPFGVVGAILPWNVPTSMFGWKTGSALAAGNTVVLKSSEKAPLTCLKIATLVKEAGFPPGVLNVLSGLGPVAGARIAEHPDIRKVSFTGSTTTGKLLMKVAADSNMKKLQLELGGKSPCIIFKDANLAETAVRLAESITFLGGQACVASSRVLVEESAAEEFLGYFRDALSAKEMQVLTDPTSDKENGLTPLVDEVQFKKVMAYIEEGKKQSPTPVVGGHRIGDKGYFVAPVLFKDLPQDSILIKQEIFGPVVCVNTFKTEEEALALANDCDYGLYASVFTQNIGRLVRCAKALESGMVGMNITSPDIATGMAFGGWKSSGAGRDGWMHGLLSMVEIKTLSLNYAS
ncbi:aldehyde dehydrogenase domain-containing protein [Trichophaea hybrida]|nr:aldehyde dehydrogenase domain-containing protein [Trichophaea hybrida]